MFYHFHLLLLRQFSWTYCLYTHFIGMAKESKKSILPLVIRRFLNQRFNYLMTSGILFITRG